MHLVNDLLLQRTDTAIVLNIEAYNQFSSFADCSLNSHLDDINVVIPLGCCVTRGVVHFA